MPVAVHFDHPICTGIHLDDRLAQLYIAHL